MQAISELRSILGEVLGWHKARLDCLSRMLLALFAVRTVNLSEIAIGFISQAQVDSSYKRLTRFFAGFKLDFVQITRWLFSLFFAENARIYLIIDRTNWYWGKSKINIFMLSVAYEGLSIPLYWKLLNKAGASSAQEQINFVQSFLKRFGTLNIEGLLADREFANGEFFAWLRRRNIPFYIRLKEGSVVRILKGRLCKADALFNHLNPKSSGIYPMTVEVFGQTVYLAGARSERGELMIVATYESQHLKHAISIYLRRWETENLFQGLKGRGFRFEDTHITKPERIEKLIAVLAIGFCWAHKVGEWYAKIRPIPMNKHIDSFRPQHTFFRYGLNFIRNILLRPVQNNREFYRRFSPCLLLLHSNNPTTGEIL